LVALLAYAGVAAVTTWPLVARITTHLPGQSTDTLVHYWNGWWVRASLARGESPFFTDYLFYPRGLSLVSHNFAWLNILVWLSLSPLVGGFPAYNLAILFNLALCGWAAFLLTRDLTGDARAAFLAGLIYQCWPYRLSQLDHPNLISTQCIPLFLLFLVRVVHHRRWRDGILTGVFFALVGYTRWQLLVPAAIVGSIYVAYALLSRAPLSRRWLPVLLLAGCIAVTALAPPLALFVQQQRTSPVQLLKEEEETSMQSDVLAYLTPSPRHPVLGAFTGKAYSRYYANRDPNRRFSPYVGVAVLVLLVLGVRAAGRASIPWVATAIVLISLALGAVLRVNGRVYPALPMPYRLASRLFVIRLLRIPDRFNMFLALPAAVLAAHGVTRILALAGRRGRLAVAAVLSLLGGMISFEYLAIPTPVQQPRTSAFYEQLAEEPDSFAVVNFPIHSHHSKQYMFAQITHGHPILQGKTPRFPEGTFDYVDGHPWLRAVRQSWGMPPDLADVSRQMASLAEDGVRYLILHKKLLGRDRVALWRRYLLSTPCFEDEEILAYPTVPLAGRDFTLTEALAPDTGPVTVLASSDCLNPGNVLEVDVGWGTQAAPARELNVELGLEPEHGPGRVAQVLPLSPSWATEEWPANTLVWGRYLLGIPPSAPPGAYTTTLALVDPNSGIPLGPPAEVGLLRISESACAGPPGFIPLNALFEDRLRLLDYLLDHDGNELRLTLRWRSERWMETDYVVFVHVLDPATGFPIAQDDSMPRRWAYPTTYWSLGEVVTDTIPISLQGLPPGSYRVAVGVYDPGTMDRLEALLGGASPEPVDQIVLPTEMVLEE
jgi:hypothetical protein